MFETARDARLSDRAFALDGLGDALAGRGQFAEAEQAFRRSIEVRRSAATPAVDFAWSQTPLARILCEHGRLDEGTALADTALKARIAEITPGHKLIAQSEAALGSCMVVAKRLDEAESMLTRAYATLSAVNGSHNQDARHAAAALANLYGRRGDAVKASDWRTKAR